MNIKMQSGARPADLAFSKCDHAIIGEVVDDRGKEAIEFLKGHCKNVHTFRYDPKKLQVDFDGQILSAEEPENFFPHFKQKSIILEATTLGFVEILLCCRALKESGVTKFALLYTEPKDYFRQPKKQIVHRRNFELSDEVDEFMAVPGNTFMLRPEKPVKTLVFAGYEGQRLSRFLEQTGMALSKCSIIFGVPAFHAGWEMNSFANYFTVIKGQEVAGHVQFCGAQNPLAAYDKINSIYNSCDKNQLLVVPIGTKPHGIASALFLTENPDVAVVYDYPKRKLKRTAHVALWHLFQSEF